MFFVHAATCNAQLLSDSHVASKSARVTKSKLSKLVDMFNFTHAQNSGAITQFDEVIDLVSKNDIVRIASRSKAKFHRRRSRDIDLHDIGYQFPKRRATKIVGKVVLVSTSMDRVEHLATENTRQQNIFVVPVASNPSVQDAAHHDKFMLTGKPRHIVKEVA